MCIRDSPIAAAMPAAFHPFPKGRPAPRPALNLPSEQEKSCLLYTSAVSSPLDFSNRTQKSSILHFGKVNKLQYLSGSGLSLQSGVAYSCIKPAQSMPTIVSSKGQSNIAAIKRYFCSEYACMMVAQMCIRDRKDDVSFAVTRLDMERGVAVGIITRIIRQNL